MYILLRLLKYVAMLKGQDWSLMIRRACCSTLVRIYCFYHYWLVAAKILQYNWSLIDQSEYCRMKADRGAHELYRYAKIPQHWLCFFLSSPLHTCQWGCKNQVWISQFKTWVCSNSEWKQRSQHFLQNGHLQNKY